MPKQRKRIAARDDRELIAPLIAFGSLVIGYFLAERVLLVFAHPFHWVAALVAGVLGYIAVIVSYSLRSRPKH